MKSIPLFLLLCLFSSPLMAQQLKVQHALRADTLQANVIQRNTGTASQLLLANGGVSGTTTANQILTSQAGNAAPIWSSTATPSSTYSLITQTRVQGSDTLRGVGINTSTPNALVAMNATGYAVNKTVYLNSNGNVGNNLAYRINSVSPKGTAGLKFKRDSTDIAYLGLQGSKTLVIQTYNNAKVGINNANPRTTLDVEGSMVASGYHYAQPWGYGVEGGGELAGNISLNGSSDFNNARIYDGRKIDYAMINGNVQMPILAGSNNAYRGKRIGLIFNGSSNSPSWTVTFGSNEYRLSNNTVATTLSAAVGRRYVFISDGTYWYLESTYSTL